MHTTCSTNRQDSAQWAAQLRFEEPRSYGVHSFRSCLSGLCATTCWARTVLMCACSCVSASISHACLCFRLYTQISARNASQTKVGLVSRNATSMSMELRMAFLAKMVKLMRCVAFCEKALGAVGCLAFFGRWGPCECCFYCDFVAHVRLRGHLAH